MHPLKSIIPTLKFGALPEFFKELDDLFELVQFCFSLCYLAKFWKRILGRPFAKYGGFGLGFSVLWGRRIDRTIQSSPIWQYAYIPKRILKRWYLLEILVFQIEIWDGNHLDDFLTTRFIASNAHVGRV